MINTSVIISIYNKIDYLKLLLAGFENQSMRRFEIIIADDGSSSENISEIERIAANSTIPVFHIWQEDKGFRKNRILNKAIMAASGEYLIFVDGDCIPHREFVREHYENREKGVCLTGRRVNLSERMTERLSEEKIRKNYLGRIFPRLIYDGILGNSFDVEKGIYLRQQHLRKVFNKKKRGLLGCNFSLFKHDIAAINGFDERYEAPSVGEDSDIQYRLELLGIQIRSLNNIAVQYHLFHKLQRRPVENLELFDRIMKEKLAFTPFGIVKNK